MKILSIYLPAFHEDEINNKAWGKGFTEWDNVKSGLPVYQNHYQPLKPLNDNYYDLSKKDDIRKQVKLAKKYGVDGFIFYHYWFGNDKKALYKPAEIYFKELEEKIDYCFCWANHSWIKNWQHGNSEMIVKQEYGNKEEWIKHINHLIPFFKDEHYIKIDNKPMLYVYNLGEIKCFNEMLKIWNKELNKVGIPGIYIVEYISSKNKYEHKESDAVVEFEPLYTTYFDISFLNKFKRLMCKKLDKIDYQDYDKLWNYNINRKRTYHGKHIQKGCFSGWDNSARKGHKSMIVIGNNPDKFYRYLEKLLENNRKYTNNDYIVINAWNEWSEGAILEPTSKDKYGYLEAIKRIKDDYNEK